DARGREVEARVRERQVLCEADHVGLHSRCWIAGDHLEPGLPEPPRDVTAAAPNVDRGLAPGRPLDNQVEIGSLAVRLALAVSFRTLAPDITHRASSSGMRFRSPTQTGARA